MNYSYFSKLLVLYSWIMYKERVHRQCQAPNVQFSFEPPPPTLPSLSSPAPFPCSAIAIIPPNFPNHPQGKQHGNHGIGKVNIVIPNRLPWAWPKEKEVSPHPTDKRIPTQTQMRTVAVSLPFLALYKYKNQSAPPDPCIYNTRFNLQSI